MIFNSISEFLKYCPVIKKDNMKTKYDIYLLDLKNKADELNINLSVVHKNSKNSHLISVYANSKNINIHCSCESSECEHVNNAIYYLLINSNLKDMLTKLIKDK